MYVLAFIGYSFLAAFEFVPLYRKKLWKDFAVNMALAIFSFTIVLLICFNIKIPSPVKPIRDLITSIFGK
jgi:hypothetical protein